MRNRLSNYNADWFLLDYHMTYKCARVNYLTLSNARVDTSS